MYCEQCQIEIHCSRSSLCFACSAGETLLNEFAESWGAASVRGIATDLAVSTVRQIRALRLLSLRLEGERQSAAEVLAERTREAEAAKRGVDLVPARAEAKEPTKEAEAPKARRKREAGDSLSSSYESYSEEEKGEPSPSLRRGESSRLQTTQSDQASGVASKSKPAVRPASVEAPDRGSRRGSRVESPKVSRETRGDKESAKETSDKRSTKSRKEKAARSRSRGEQGRERKAGDKRSGPEKGDKKSSRLLDERLLKLQEDEPEKPKTTHRPKSRQRWRRKWWLQMAVEEKEKTTMGTTARIT